MTISRRDAIRVSGVTLAGLSLGALKTPGSVCAEEMDREVGRLGEDGRVDGAVLADETRQLARFVVDTEFRDLPEHLVGEWKTVVLDALGVGFVGSVSPLARRVSAMARKLGGRSECTLINQSDRTDMARRLHHRDDHRGGPVRSVQRRARSWECGFGGARCSGA